MNCGYLFCIISYLFGKNLIFLTSSNNALAVWKILDKTFSEIPTILHCYPKQPFFQCKFSPKYKINKASPELCYFVAIVHQLWIITQQTRAQQVKEPHSTPRSVKLIEDLHQLVPNDPRTRKQHTHIQTHTAKVSLLYQSCLWRHCHSSLTVVSQCVCGCVCPRVCLAMMPCLSD